MISPLSKSIRTLARVILHLVVFVTPPLVSWRERGGVGVVHMVIRRVVVPARSM